ncbi:dentin sialophosphoprotein-like [Mercenaria mercenaria]|uniref:dentin sialophosphoprotein-like n=1 Tax=Mercenaria mercenaria TaxID=6596 RepID=UPI001E1DAC3D|nr:dentin sialophosphoprotein-like [Mercenaria mercenaria]XP_045164979.1 dentin sialophosphoprotein-like [Mercenaria mercenaria]
METPLTADKEKDENRHHTVKFSEDLSAESNSTHSDKQSNLHFPFENGTDGTDIEKKELESSSMSANKPTDLSISDSGQAGDNDLRQNNGMNESHAESGYLTDSVISRERDSTQDSVGSSNNSEQDITPCAENLITFSTDSSNAGSSLTSPVSPYSEVSNDTDNSTSCNTDQIRSDSDQVSSEAEDHVGQVNKIYDECTAIINQTSRIEQLDSLARMSLNCDRKDLMSIDDIIATNFVPVRPERLIMNSEISGSRGRSQSEALESYTDSFHLSCDKTDGRKRSKSSGFPIPRQKEGVLISEDMLSKSLPHGKVVRSDSGLIEFIADDLQEKIRRSSPMSKTASSDVSSRRSSILSLTSVDSMASSSMATSMTSGMSRSYPQSPDCIPPIDPMAVHEIENQARLVADSLDHMMGNLRNNLHQMSAISVGCEEAYKTSVDVTCDSVDASIKSMYAMMAKCEELSMAMEPVYKLADQIKEIKRLLDRFESQIGEKP